MNARNLTTLTLRQARRVAIFVVGVTVGLFGLVMLVTPGPGIAVIVLALAILAVEFAWARRLLVDARSRVNAAGKAWRGRGGRAAAAAQRAAEAPAPPAEAPPAEPRR